MDRTGENSWRDRGSVRARGGSLLCLRCGEEVQAESDKSGWSHHDWRRRAATVTAAAAASRVASRRVGRKRSKLEAALDKLERRLLGSVQPAEQGGGVTMGEAVITYCNACLNELGRRVPNQPLVSEILRFRQTDVQPVTGPATLRRHSPIGRLLLQT